MSAALDAGSRGQHDLSPIERTLLPQMVRSPCAGEDRTRQSAVTDPTRGHGYPAEMDTAPWSGPSGETFAQMITERVREVAGTSVEVRQVDPAAATPASYLVIVDWPNGRGVIYEVADSIQGVRVMDDDAHDVTVESALQYLQARISGVPPHDAQKVLSYLA